MRVRRKSARKTQIQNGGSCELQKCLHLMSIIRDAGQREQVLWFLGGKKPVRTFNTSIEQPCGTVAELMLQSFGKSMYN